MTTWFGRVACKYFYALLMVVLNISANASGTVEQKKDTRRSGVEFMSRETQAMQQDDTQNPAMLWVEEGRALWDKNAPNGTSCAGCHHQVEKTMRGVAASYPKYSATQKRVVNLSQQINDCRTTKQKLPALPPEDNALLSLETAVAHQSRGLAIQPTSHPALTRAQAQGKKIFHTSIGQVDLSCHDCHVRHAGKRLSGSTIPEAHATGYPIYRLEWQTVGSLARRLRGCFVAVRAEPYTAGSAEMISLESYLMLRAAGMKMESPAVRP